MISAFVLIEAKPSSINELAQSIAEIDGVREAHSVTGSQCDLVAILSVPNHDSIARVVTEEISKLDGISDTSTMIAFRSFSSGELDAGFEGFGD